MDTQQAIRIMCEYGLVVRASAIQPGEYYAIRESLYNNKLVFEGDLKELELFIRDLAFEES